jgi:outer membrane protein insertion porin family
MRPTAPAPGPVTAPDTLSGFGSGAQAPAPLAAPAEENADFTVGVLHVRGNVFVDSARIVRTFDLPQGSHFSYDAVRRGIKKLNALHLFDDLSVDTQPHDGVMDLVITVKERLRIASIAFTGNKKRESGELERKLFLHTGDPYSPAQVQTQIDTLLQYYHDEGYARAAIAAKTDTSAHGLALTFDVSEGERVRITAIRFEGVSQVAESRLRKALETKKKGFFGGGEIKDESFSKDIDKLTGFFRDNGYRDAKVTGTKLEPGLTPKQVTLVITVDQGQRYSMGDVKWSGNTVVPDAVLQGLTHLQREQIYNASSIQKTIADAYGEYAERGYLYLQIEPHEEVNANRHVDVTFFVSEGQPSHIRYVNISGNKGTREKVIRREVSVHEGDRFRRSALMRTQGDLMRLGFFENVDIDFQPAESTDVDITLKVHEKAVGTASAGAAYAGSTGLTGFIDIGHNNVLGNGQQVALHLERGSRRSDYSLSFTEPWFHDTPTLLGYSVFNTQQAYDLYTQKQVGASVRIGRPIRWPDFSRVSFGYQIENVTILGDTLVGSTNPALQGQTVGVPVLTISANADLQRNTTDNPFYPTKGTRLVWTNMFAGGIFGGSVNYHLHRVEGRWYTRSILRHVVTMMRGRFGFVDEYADQNLQMPPYVRLRLGGGSTLDPLRGYDDYQVVPEENIKDTYTTSVVNGDTITTRTRVRYPGGRFATTYTLEEQFAIVNPLHGVIFGDAGNVWNYSRQYQPFVLRKSLGVGLRLEIPILGNVGFDYAYGFDRDDGARFVGHFLLGPASF